jgi:hypothetical protein
MVSSSYFYRSIDLDQLTIQSVFDELTTLMETLVLQSYPVVIGGDFKVHVEDPTNPDTVRQSELFGSFNLVQNVNESTH